MNEDKTNLILAQERTLLAAERTFSAWLRTALATMAGGIAILRLINFKTQTHRIIAHIAGETLILWSCILIVVASIDYKKIQNKLTLVKNYKSSPIGFIIIVLPLFIVSALILLITF